MELKCKETYHSGLCSLYPGDTTDQLNLPEEVKAQMLADFPDLFEVFVPNAKRASVTPAPAVDEVEVQNQEDKMEVENQEAKMTKTRKKA